MRARVSGATSVRPLTTLDTVGRETPAAAAIEASVARGGSRGSTVTARVPLDERRSDDASQMYRNICDPPTWITICCTPRLTCQQTRQRSITGRYRWVDRP